MNKQKGFSALILLLGITVLIVVVGISGFYIGNRNNKVSQDFQKTTTKPQDSSSEKIFQKTVQLKERTVSYAKIDMRLYIKYKGNIYNDSNQWPMEPVTLPGADTAKWNGLVEGPETATNSWDEVFSFKVLSNNRDFLFVMRWGKEANSGVVEQDFVVYYFNGSANKLSDIAKFVLAGDVGYNVPKIDQISTDSKYVSFNMFGCWNCGGHKTETLLLNLETNEIKRIGKVSLFNWKDNGQYEYKEYLVKECEEPAPGECSESPDNLPIKIGQF